MCIIACRAGRHASLATKFDRKVDIGSSKVDIESANVEQSANCSTFVFESGGNIAGNVLKYSHD